jgi:hypothetical protein
LLRLYLVDGGGVDLHGNVKAAKNGAKTIGIFIREMMETAGTYENAIQMLNNTEVIAPAYYIIAGTKNHEGAVVTRSRPGPDESAHQGIWSIEDGTKAPDGSPSWYGANSHPPTHNHPPTTTHHLPPPPTTTTHSPRPVMSFFSMSHRFPPA